jgi:allantoinase
MDHAHYDYSALPRRPLWKFRNRERVGAYVVLVLEHWDFDPPPGAIRDPRLVGEFGSFEPDYRSWTQREYGLRIGVFRVMEALREAGVTPCVAANARAVERLPQLVSAFNDWGCEWLAHGISATRMMHSRMPPSEQRVHIDESIDVIKRTCGQRPTGWLSQDWGTTPDTFQLLADAGITHTLDWPNDEQPFWLKTRPAVLSVPMSPEWDDVQCQWLRHVEPRAHARLVDDGLARLRQECERDDRTAVLGVAVHPWVSGMSSRICGLRQMLSLLRAQPGVWWTSPGAIREAWAAD